MRGKFSGIYLIINIITNQFYVGSSIDLSRRKCKHFRLLEQKRHFNKHLQSSYNLYGKENFTFQIIEFLEPHINFIIEQIYIDAYWDNGIKCFNQNKKTDHPNPQVFSEERKKKVSALFKGVKKTPEHIKKVAEAAMKPVVQMAKDWSEIHTFRSAREAAIATGVSYKHISRICRNGYGRNTAGGFRWKFKND